MTTLEAKDPDRPKTYSIDWRTYLVDEVQRATEYGLGDVVRPHRTTGLYYECTTAGLTSRQWPVWPRTAAETVTDGSVVWTAVHPDGASLTTVSSAVWTVPSGLTLDSQSESDTHTHVTLSGGTDGEDYDVVCTMTPSSGNAVDQTVTIPVRQL